jgi:hypothetical protein
LTAAWNGITVVTAKFFLGGGMPPPEGDLRHGYPRASGSARQIDLNVHVLGR